MRPQVNALGHIWRLCTRVHCGFHQRPKRDCRENVDIAIEIPSVDRNQQIAGTGGESVKMARGARIADIQRCDAAIDVIS